MDYAAWKLFIDAAELGSLSKVAVAYGTSQPHISRRIGELEQACGGRLFERTGRGVVLTELGQRIAPKVRAWMVSTDQLVNDVRTSDHEIRVAEIDMGPGRFVPGDDPVAIPEEGRPGGNAGHLRLHKAGG